MNKEKQIIDFDGLIIPKHFKIIKAKKDAERKEFMVAVYGALEETILEVDGVLENIKIGKEVVLIRKEALQAKAVLNNICLAV